MSIKLGGLQGMLLEEIVAGTLTVHANSDITEFRFESVDPEQRRQRPTDARRLQRLLELGLLQRVRELDGADEWVMLFPTQAGVLEAFRHRARQSQILRGWEPYLVLPAFVGVEGRAEHLAVVPIGGAFSQDPLPGLLGALPKVWAVGRGRVSGVTVRLRAFKVGARRFVGSVYEREASGVALRDLGIPTRSESGRPHWVGVYWLSTYLVLEQGAMVEVDARFGPRDTWLQVRCAAYGGPVHQRVVLPMDCMGQLPGIATEYRPRGDGTGRLAVPGGDRALQALEGLE